MLEVFSLNGNTIGFHWFVCSLSLRKTVNKIHYVDLNSDADHMKENEVFLNLFTLRVPLAHA